MLKFVKIILQRKPRAANGGGWDEAPPSVEPLSYNAGARAAEFGRARMAEPGLRPAALSPPVPSLAHGRARDEGLIIWKM